MRRLALTEILHEIDQIHDVITLDCQIRARTQIKAHLDRITELCKAEHITNNGRTMKSYEMKCKVTPEDMMASGEYIRLLNMAKGDVVEIECDKHHFQYLRALLKKHNPSFRLRTINLCGIRRRLMRVDDGD
jgi:hypothetical protein